MKESAINATWAAHRDLFTAGAMAQMKAVFDELCQIVEEAIALYHKEGRAVPPATSGRDFANKMQNVA